jgi:hypothetical protein
VRRVKFNAIVNVFGFAVFAVLVATGLVELMFLPPGTGGRGRGAGPAVTVFGLGRHGWGDIHNMAGVAMLAIVALHLILHWRWIKCLPKLLAAAGRSPAVLGACPESVRASGRADRA